MKNIVFDYSNSGISKEEIQHSKWQLESAHKILHARTGSGNDFLGWIDLPYDYDKEEFERVKKAAQKVRENSDVFIVIGIGGSYLGARAVIEGLNHSFYNMLPKEKRQAPVIYFVGNNISGTYVTHLLELIEGKDVSINVISKSGTTTEPGIAFRIFKKYLEEKYGKEGAKERIFATTDRQRGALRKLADEEGYETFIIPDDVGGRFTVLTPVGLLPIAVRRNRYRSIMAGQRMQGISEKTLKTTCYQYA